MADLMGELGLDTNGFTAGIAAATASLGVLTKATTDFAGALADTAAQLNLTAEAVQELNYAFGQSGASANDVNAAFTKLNQSIDEAREGNEKTIASFENLGITWRDILTSSPDELLMKIAEGSKNATDKVAALDSIVELLGRSGKKMAAGLSEGADAIGKMRDEATKLTNEEVKKLDEIGDKWSRINNEVKVYLSRILLTATEGGQTSKTKLEEDAKNAAVKAGLIPPDAPKRDLAKMFADAEPKHLDDTPIPDDPREVEANRKKEEAANERAWKKREETIKKAEEAEKKLLRDTLEKYEQIQKSRTESNKADRERLETNKKINDELQKQAVVEDLSRKGNQTMARREKISQDFDSRIREEIKRGNKDGVEALQREQNAELAKLEVEEDQKTVADRREERKSGRQLERNETKARQHFKDLDDRIKRGAKGDKNSEIEQRREQLRRDAERAGGIEAEKAKSPEQAVWSQNDSTNLQTIANAYAAQPN